MSDPEQWLNLPNGSHHDEQEEDEPEIVKLDPNKIYESSDDDEDENKFEKQTRIRRRKFFIPNFVISSFRILFRAQSTKITPTIQSIPTNALFAN